MLIEKEADLQISFDQIFCSPYKEYFLGNSEDNLLEDTKSLVAE